jgi:hypothetical protein
MNASNFPEQRGRRGFVRAVLGSSLVAAAGMPATSASATGSRAAEPGLPFHAWAPAPAMGWNSRDAFGASVTEAEYLDNARILADRFLSFGYDIATVDIQWYEAGAKSSWYRPFAPLELDDHGRPQPAPNRFPSATGGRGFAPLAEQVHRLGLRFGVHLMRGIPRQAVGLELPIAGSTWRCHEVASPGSTCAWNHDMCGVNPDHPGAFDWYRAWFAQLAEWGVDFVKVDDIAAPNYQAREVELIRRAIDAAGRPMRAQPADAGQRPAPARRLDAAPGHQPRGAGTAARARHARMAQHGAGPPLRLHRPAGHLGRVAQHQRRAVACAAARVAAGCQARLLGALRPPAGTRTLSSPPHGARLVGCA